MFLKRTLILGASRFVLEEDLASEWDNVRSDLLLVLLWVSIFCMQSDEVSPKTVRLTSIFAWRLEDGDYAQTLTFRGDGKIVQQPQLSDSAWRVSDRMYLQVPKLSGLTPLENEQMSLSLKGIFILTQPSFIFEGTFLHFQGRGRGLTILIRSSWCNWTLRWSCLEAVWVLLQLPTMDRWAKYLAKWQETWKSDRWWRLQTKARLA